MKHLARILWIAFAVSGAVLTGCMTDENGPLSPAGPDVGPLEQKVFAEPWPGAVNGNGNDNGTNENGNDNGTNENGNDNGTNENGNDNGTNENGNDNGTNENGNDNGTNENGNDNGTNENGNDNGTNENGNDNGTNENGNDNGKNENGNDNGTNENGNDNGTNENGNDNGTNENGNDNGTNENGNDNGTNENGNDNGTNENGNDNGGDGPCPDGSTQLYTEMGGSDDNRAEYDEFPSGCREFRVRVRDLAPYTQYDVIAGGVTVGTLSTDDDGRGELRYETGGFPTDFPALGEGDGVSVGPVSGSFDLSCSNGNCNG